jgi:hypothetical protein
VSKVKGMYCSVDIHKYSLYLTTIRTYIYMILPAPTTCAHTSYILPTYIARPARVIINPCHPGKAEPEKTPKNKWGVCSSPSNHPSARSRLHRRWPWALTGGVDHSGYLTRGFSALAQRPMTIALLSCVRTTQVGTE